jgi:hypothetical protein
VTLAHHKLQQPSSDELATSMATTTRLNQY